MGDVKHLDKENFKVEFIKNKYDLVIKNKKYFRFRF